MRRFLVVALAGAALRELIPLLHILADYLDPCATAPGWTAPPKPVEPEPVLAPDYIPDALLVRW